jgi:hypothetical protein
MARTSLRKIFDRLPWSILIILSLFLGLAPFHPQPHLVEKISMFINGTLHSPMDIFDLVFHSVPLLLLSIKLTLTIRTRHDT